MIAIEARDEFVVECGGLRYYIKLLLFVIVILEKSCAVFRVIIIWSQNENLAGVKAQIARESIDFQTRSVSYPDNISFRSLASVNIIKFTYQFTRSRIYSNRHYHFAKRWRAR
jgi:predicted aminopeptidase